MGAVVMTVALDRPLLADTCCVNVPKAEGLTFLPLVEHTNMIDASHYGGDHLLYLGDYLKPSHRYFAMSQEAWLEEFLTAQPRCHSEFRPEWVTGAWMHRATYAQPVPASCGMRRCSRSCVRRCGGCISRRCEPGVVSVGPRVYELCGGDWAAGGGDDFGRLT